MIQSNIVKLLIEVCPKLLCFISIGYVNVHVVRGSEEQPEEHDENESFFNANGQLNDANHKFILDKSNILLMGPTGSGDLICIVNVYH